MVAIMDNKIPRWWYVGFKKNFFYGCWDFIKTWWASASNPWWTIKYKVRKWWYR